MKYQSNFLSQVIFRVDFDAHTHPEVEGKPKFASKIRPIYSHIHRRSISKLSVEIKPDGPGVQQTQMSPNWEFRKLENGNQVIVLAPDFLSIEWGKGAYTHFANFYDETKIILDALTEESRILNVNRIGLRYINEISLDRGSVFDWDGLINPNLVTSIKSGMPAGMHLFRSMHQLQCGSGEQNLLLNYGIFNPDYPSPAVRRQFILDIDCYQTGLIEANEICGNLRNYNRMCEEVFESCIEDGLREILGVIPNA